MYKVHAIGRVSTTMPNIGLAVCGSYHGGIIIPSGIHGAKENIFNPRFSFPEASITIIKKVSFDEYLTVKIKGPYGTFSLCKNCVRLAQKPKTILDPVLRRQLAA